MIDILIKHRILLLFCSSLTFNIILIPKQALFVIVAKFNLTIHLMIIDHLSSKSFIIEYSYTSHTWTDLDLCGFYEDINLHRCMFSLNINSVGNFCPFSVF